MTRLDQILQANQQFQHRITPEKLPTRAPEPLAIITCMDPRINLEAVGVPAFSPDGEGHSDIRIIRSIGGIADPRSLIVGVFLAGIREFIVLMHTDCGCCLAWSKIDVIVENMATRLPSDQLQTFKHLIGADPSQPYRDTLRSWLKTFDDPRTAIEREVNAIHAQSYMPDDIIVHGLLYDVSDGGIEVIVNGYKHQAN